MFCAYPYVNLLFIFMIIFVFLRSSHAFEAMDVPFQSNYQVSYSRSYTQLLNNCEEIMLSIDKYSGSGFRSLKRYGSGFFGIKLKLPKRDTTGIITTFYLISSPNSDEYRDEVDFEFLGNKRAPYVLSTNVISNGNLHREQQFTLWFDPTADYHLYQILWNPRQLVLFVDNIPVRVFKNDPRIGPIFPKKPMEIQGTIWNATWASNGKPADWSQGPFQAYYAGFGIAGCPTTSYSNNIHPNDCYGPNYEWNRRNYWALDRAQQEAYLDVRGKHLTYDYCTKTNPPPPECKINH